MELLGSLAQVDLPALVELARQLPDACLRLYSDGNTAVIYLRDGEVVHATSGLQEGEPALLFAFSLRHGTFTLQSHTPAPDQTIELPWNSLLLNALNHLDDQANDLHLDEPDALWDFDDDDDGGFSVSYHGENMVLSGGVDPQNLPELISTAQQMSKPSRLQIGMNGQTQTLFILDTDVIHAQAGALVGPAAFYEIFTHAHGHFTLEEGIYPHDITINWPWAELLNKAVAYKQVHATDPDSTPDWQTTLRLLAERQTPPALSTAVVHLDGRLIASYGEFDPALANKLALMLHLGRTSGQTFGQLSLTLDNSRLILRPHQLPDHYLVMRLKNSPTQRS
jgi:hypothetical protein